MRYGQFLLFYSICVHASQYLQDFRLLFGHFPLPLFDILDPFLQLQNISVYSFSAEEFLFTPLKMIISNVTI